jgi:hypothetical protein
LDPFTFHKIDTKSLPVSLETPSRGKCKEIRRQTVSTGVKKAQISMALWVRHRDFISTECWGEIIENQESKRCGNSGLANTLRVGVAEHETELGGYRTGGLTNYRTRTRTAGSVEVKYAASTG